MRVYGNRHLSWRGNNLVLNNKTIVAIVPDKTYPQMYRVRLPDGQLTDMVNRTRARDAARGLALAILNRQESDVAASPIAQNVQQPPE